MVTAINGSTFQQDMILFWRDILRSNITDPLGRNGSEFVYSSYPQKNVKYPIITVKSAPASPAQRLGMRSEAYALNLPIEVRVWARKESEKDQLFQEIHYFVQTNQFGTGSVFENVELHDTKMLSAVDVDEAGEENVKSKVIQFNQFFIST